MFLLLLFSFYHFKTLTNWKKRWNRSDKPIFVNGLEKGFNRYPSYNYSWKHLTSPGGYGGYGRRSRPVHGPNFAGPSLTNHWPIADQLRAVLYSLLDYFYYYSFKALTLTVSPCDAIHKSTGRIIYRSNGVKQAVSRLFL